MHPVGKKKKRRRDSRLPTLSKIVVHERTKSEQIRMKNEEFVDLFRVFFTAVSHELANSFAILYKNVLEHVPEKIDDMEELMGCYKRLERILKLTKNATICSGEDKAKEYVLASDKEMTGNPFSNANTAKIDELKREGLVETKKFHKYLNEMEDMIDPKPEWCEEEDHFKIGRAIKFGKMLAITLKDLMEGNLSIADDTVRQTIGDVNTTGIVNWISRVAELSDCRFYIKCSDEQLLKKRVFVNPMISLLIMVNILSNARRAMKEARQKGQQKENQDGQEPAYVSAVVEIPGGDKPLSICESTGEDDFEPEIIITISQKGEMAVFEFTDSGCGMTQETMEKLNSGISVTTKIEEGKHGIGFKYCRKLAGRMFGKLYVKESTPGVGTTVALELKLNG